jgi:hypothetical protein
MLPEPGKPTAPKAPQPARPKPITREKITSILLEAGHREARLTLGTRGQHNGRFIPGFRVFDWLNDFIWISYSCGWAPPDREELTPVLESYATALTAAGIACEVRDGAVYVKVDQGTKGDTANGDV